MEHWVGRVLQGCHTATQILDVVEGVLDRLADDVGSTATELGSRRIELSPKGIRQTNSDWNHRDPSGVSEMSVTSSCECIAFLA
jgi:hypothetical protein